MKPSLYICFNINDIVNNLNKDERLFFSDEENIKNEIEHMRFDRKNYNKNTGIVKLDFSSRFYYIVDNDCYGILLTPDDNGNISYEEIKKFVFTAEQLGLPILSF